MVACNKKLNECFTFAYHVQKPDIPTVGRQKEIGEALDTLYKTRMRNLILVGPAGVGKTHLIREVAQQSPNHVFYEISAAGLVAGQSHVGDFEKRVESLILQALYEQNHQEKKLVLFFDEVHTMIGAGSTQAFRYELDLAQILKPVLSAGQLAIWGATTKKEFEESIAVDKALTRRFDVIELEPLEKEETLETLRRFSQGLVDEDTLKQILAESGRDNLDAAVSKLDRYLAHQRRIESFEKATRSEPTLDQNPTPKSKKPSTMAIESAIRRKGTKL